MPIKHDVLIRFNRAAPRAACEAAAVKMGLNPEVFSSLAEGDEAGLAEARNQLFADILGQICNLKDQINAAMNTIVISEASFSANESIVPEDRRLAELHGVTHKVSMKMDTPDLVSVYFNHPLHNELLEKFKDLEGAEDSIFLPGGFAIPFDTKEELTPRSVKEMVEETGNLPFENAEEAAAWALVFKNTFRGNGVPRLRDLANLVNVVKDKKPEYAAAIEASIKG